MSTDDHKQAMWAGQAKIMVVVRTRPQSERERRLGKGVVRVMDERVVVVMDPDTNSKDILRANRAQDRQYAFDHAFSEHASQEYVYENSTRFLIEGVVNGFNATVFAYGATGAGKTYTMLGTPEAPGIMILTLQDLFAMIAEYSRRRGLEFRVSLTYIEVYNEMIRDLLAPSSGELDLREDPIKGPVVAGVTELLATSTDEVMNLLRRGNKNRSQEPTAANKESSRSHAVLQILVEQQERSGESKKIGKLSLVDLAGSERASSTKNSGIRLIEGANINRSLLALGNCINALTQGSKGSFVPYRDSKLTRLLKDSLGGNCRTVMIANVSPCSSSFEETLNTLKYADRAKRIKTNLSRNVLNVNYHISEYEHLIASLRSEISTLKEQLAKVPVQDETPMDGLMSRRGVRESKALEQLRSELVNNFKERMQLRRSLIELQAQNVQNHLEIKRRQQMLDRWSSSHPDMNDSRDEGADADAESDIDDRNQRNSLPHNMAQCRQEMEEFQHASESNEETKASIAARLKENEMRAAAVREQLHTLITSEERKELLNLEYRIGLLELDNMELEHSRMLHEHVVHQRDTLIESLRQQIAARDRLIYAQHRALENAGLGHLVDLAEFHAMEVANSELAMLPLEEIVPQRRAGDLARLVPKVSRMPSAASFVAAQALLPGITPIEVHSISPHHSPILTTPRRSPVQRQQEIMSDGPQVQSRFPPPRSSVAAWVGSGQSVAAPSYSSQVPDSLPPIASARAPMTPEGNIRGLRRRPSQQQVPQGQGRALAPKPEVNVFASAFSEAPEDPEFDDLEDQKQDVAAKRRPQGRKQWANKKKEAGPKQHKRPARSSFAGDEGYARRAQAAAVPAAAPKSMAVNGVAAAPAGGARHRRPANAIRRANSDAPAQSLANVNARMAKVYPAGVVPQAVEPLDDASSDEQESMIEPEEIAIHDVRAPGGARGRGGNIQASPHWRHGGDSVSVSDSVGYLDPYVASHAVAVT